MNALRTRDSGTNSLGVLKELYAPGALTVAFQPIVEVCGGRRRLHGVESLTRGPRGTELERAVVLFDRVRQLGIEVEVDRLCSSLAIQTGAALPAFVPMSVNV